MHTTFEQQAAREYGSPDQAELLKKANPGAQAGGVLITPRVAGDPVNRPHQAPAADINEVVLTIEGERFRYWESMSIKRTLDSIDTITITAPFSADVPEFRATFRPFSYKPLTVTVGGAPLFTGTSVSISPQLSESSKTVNVAGYATCGVLNDVTLPASALPAEFNKLTLDVIASQLCEPFGVSAEFTGVVGAPFERVACDPSRKLLEFLAELAKERGLIITSNPEGNLVFYKPTAGTPPVAVLEQGVLPLLAVTPKFNPQNYFSHITGLESSKAGKKGGQSTVKNPHVTEGVRPLNFSVTNSEKDTDIAAAVKAKAGRMVGNMASYTLDVTEWRDSAGKLWTPGDYITLKAPDAFIYNVYTFLIREVTLDRHADNMTASIELSIPGAFSGEMPEGLPWDE